MRRRTKIVTTIGPASESAEMLEKLLKAGANVFRLNFSHGTPEDHMSRASLIRELAAKLGLEVAILGDLQGPKIRVSTFKEGKIWLEVGDSFTLDADLPRGEGNKEVVGLDYKELPNDVVNGDLLLLDDGRVQLEVTGVDGNKVLTKVVVGGPLSDKKGINKKGGGLSADALTDKDKADILTAAKINVDYLAISFPRNGADMNYARELATAAGLNAQLVAKVERAEVVASDEALDEVILASDAVMVARGDLGVEIGDPELVGVQKKMIARARALNRAVITATQMMESMINQPMPTRAEVMDVANAVLDGTDAVMLSAETASGKYPEETVKAMASVCIGAEKHPRVNVSRHRINEHFGSYQETAAMAAMYAANHLQGVKAIVALTDSGSTPLMMSRITSGLPIYGMSRHKRTLSKMALYRGVRPVPFDMSKHTEDTLVRSALECLLEKGLIQKGDMVIMTKGDVANTSGTTNTVKFLVA